MSDRVQLIYRHKLGKVVRSYEQGLDIKVIAKGLNVSPPTVSKWLRQEGYRYKRKGHYPQAMRMRAQELGARGWSNERVAKLLRVEASRVQEWLGRTSNPILGGEKDPLKLSFKERREIERSKKGRKKGLQKGGKKKADKPWPPPAHRCRKNWNDDEKKYVLQLIKKKRSIRYIYQHMRASRKQQLKMWREAVGDKDAIPPNFPPKKELPCFIGGLSRLKLSKKDLEELIGKAKAISGEEGEKLRSLEAEYKKKRKRSLELQETIQVEDERVEALGEAAREKALELQAAEERAKALKAWEKRTKRKLPAAPPEAPKRRRVTAGSYEADVLGLPVGSAIKKPKEPRGKRVPKAVVEYADNGEFFEVSNEWGDLGELNDDKGASEDELKIFADFLTKEGFPTKVTPKGDQPKAHYKDLWPKAIERKWMKATDRAVTFLDAYVARKNKLTESRFSPKVAQNILRYLRDAYDAFRNPDASPKQRSKAGARMKRVWENLDTIDRAVLIFWRGFADKSGTPTQKALDWGTTAKRLLVKEDEGRVAKHLAKRKKMREKTSAKELLEARKRELGLLPPEDEE